MSKTFIHTSRPLPRVDPFPRIAVGLQDESEREAFVSLLATGGLPVTAALSIRRVSDLLADPPDALVLFADARSSSYGHR